MGSSLFRQRDPAQLTVYLLDISELIDPTAVCCYLCSYMEATDA